MKKVVLLALIITCSFGLSAQSFEITGLQDIYRGTIGDIIRAPLLIRNTTSRPLSLIIRKANSQIGTSQKNYFCFDSQCLDQKIEDYSLRLEPGHTLNAFQVALEAGLVPGISSVKYIAYNRSNPSETLDLEFNFIVDERPKKQNIYASRSIMLQDLYPNPAYQFAMVDYKILTDNIDAKIVLHNILGNRVGEYELPALENKAKIRTDDLTAGVYFYTLYINGESVLTRKLIVKK